MNDLVSIVKNNLPSNTSLIKEPFKVRLRKTLVRNHEIKGFVFNLRTKFSDGSSHEEMLFVSEVEHRYFHNATSLFGKSLGGLCYRCYWVDENDLVRMVFKI